MIKFLVIGLCLFIIVGVEGYISASSNIPRFPTEIYKISERVISPDEIYLQNEGDLDIRNTQLYTKTELEDLDFSGSISPPFLLSIGLFLILVLVIISMIGFIYRISNQVKSKEAKLRAKQKEIESYVLRIKEKEEELDEIKTKLHMKERELDEIKTKLHMTEEELKKISTQATKVQPQVGVPIPLYQKIVEAFNQSGNLSEWKEKFKEANYYRITLPELPNLASISNYTEYSFVKNDGGFLILIEAKNNFGYIIPICGVVFGEWVKKYYKDFFNLPTGTNKKVKKMVKPAYVEVIGDKLKIIEKGELIFEGEEYVTKENSTLNLISINDVYKEIENLKGIVQNFQMFIEKFPFNIKKEIGDEVERRLRELKIEIKEGINNIMESIKVNQRESNIIELQEKEVEINEEAEEKVEFPILKKCADIYNKYYSNFDFNKFKDELRKKVEDVDIEVRYWIDSARGYKKEYIYLKIRSEAVESIFPILKEYSMPPEKSFIKEFLVGYYEIPQTSQINIKKIKKPVIIKEDEVKKGELEIQF